MSVAMSFSWQEPPSTLSAHLTSWEKQLLDAIATLTADKVTLHLTDPGRPMILTDADDTTYRHVLMPVRLAG